MTSAPAILKETAIEAAILQTGSVPVALQETRQRSEVCRVTSLAVEQLRSAADCSANSIASDQERTSVRIQGVCEFQL
jgi:hypothetical protein